MARLEAFAHFQQAQFLLASEIQPVCQDHGALEQQP
jgi:hypothetical protein